MFNRETTEIIPSLVYINGKLVENYLSEYRLSGTVDLQYTSLLEELENILNSNKPLILEEDGTCTQNFKGYNIVFTDEDVESARFKCIIKVDKVYLFSEDVWVHGTDKKIQQKINFINDCLSGITELSEVQWFLKRMGLKLQDFNIQDNLYKFKGVESYFFSIVLERTVKGFIVKHLLDNYPIGKCENTKVLMEIGLDYVTSKLIISQSLIDKQGWFSTTNTDLTCPLNELGVTWAEPEYTLNNNKTVTLNINGTSVSVPLLTRLNYQRASI